MHMNGRVYDPRLARFTSADPIVQDPYNPQSWNRYSYVLNNPLKLTDPTGFCSDEDGFTDCGAPDPGQVDPSFFNPNATGEDATPLPDPSITVPATGAFGTSLQLGGAALPFNTSAGLAGSLFDPGNPLAPGLPALGDNSLGGAGSPGGLVGSSLALGGAPIFLNGTATNAYTYANSGTTDSAGLSGSCQGSSCGNSVVLGFVGPVLAYAIEGAITGAVATAAAVAAGVAVALYPSSTATDDTCDNGKCSGSQTQLSPQYVIRGGLSEQRSILANSSPAKGFSADSGIGEISSSSAPGYSLDDLARQASYPNKVITWTTVDALQAAGFQVILTPTPQNPVHADILTSYPLSPDEANKISTIFNINQPFPNPYRR